MSTKREIVIPTPEEDTAINAGIAADPDTFELTGAAFERLKPELMRQYPEKVVAIVGGEVAEVGDDKLELYSRVRARFGDVSMFIQHVTEKPRIYHIPSPRVVRP